MKTHIVTRMHVCYKYMIWNTEIIYTQVRK